MNGLSFFDNPGPSFLGALVGCSVPLISGTVAGCCSGRNVTWKSRDLREWGVAAFASVLCYSPLVIKELVSGTITPFLGSFENNPATISCFITGIKVGIAYALILSMSTLGHLGKENGTTSYRFSTAIPAHIAGGSITYFVISLLSKLQHNEGCSATIGLAVGMMASAFLGYKLIKESNRTKSVQQSG